MGKEINFYGAGPLQTEFKYKEGDKVWYIYDKEIVCSEIVCIEQGDPFACLPGYITKQSVKRLNPVCTKATMVLMEKTLFPSKEALLEHLEQNVEYDYDKISNKTKE
jgi:hypothetical protein